MAVLVPASGGRKDGAVLLAVAAAMTLVGTAIGYPLWRFWLRGRFTVCAANHAGYLILMLIIVAINPKLTREIAYFMTGPLSFFGGLRYMSPDDIRFWTRLAILAMVTCCLVLLMSAHTFRRNLIGASLTALGTAMWYLAGLYAILARGP